MISGDNYIYFLGDALYINLTNRCCNDCEFCLRRTGEGVKGSNLWLSREPSAEEIIAEIGACSIDFTEAIFCGYGESTYRMDELTEVAKHLKSIGKKVRLNTNGLGSLINKRDITADLKGLIDSVSVSLNHADAESYNKICRPIFVENAFEGLLDFSKKCTALGINTVLTVVDVIGEANVEKCKKLCASLGLNLKVRAFISSNEDYV